MSTTPDQHNYKPRSIWNNNLTTTNKNKHTQYFNFVFLLPLLHKRNKTHCSCYNAFSITDFLLFGHYTPLNSWHVCYHTRSHDYCLGCRCHNDAQEDIASYQKGYNSSCKAPAFLATPQYNLHMVFAEIL